jgi:hypothetical protein
MKLEVGQFVRTKDGYISQYKYYNTTNMGKLLCIPLSNGTFANIEDIVKASYNIINILEVEDYVNGKKIINVILEDICGNEILDNQHIFTKDGEIFENEIETIVTHEQMEQMAFKVEE